MQFPFTEEEYLNMHRILFEKQIQIVNASIIPNIEYTVIERPMLYRPAKELYYRKYTVNINPWLCELSELRNHIIFEILLTLASELAACDFEDSTKGYLRYIERDRYLRLSIYDLFSYREKLAFLIYELFDRRIAVNEKRKINFDTIHKYLISKDKNGFDWLDDSEVELIVNSLDRLKQDNAIKALFDLRNAYTHRGAPGIDCLSIRIHEYNKIQGVELDIQRKFSQSMGEKNWRTQEFMSIGSKPFEIEKDFETVKTDLLSAWKLMSDIMRTFITDIKIINDEIDEVIA